MKKNLIVVVMVVLVLVFAAGCTTYDYKPYEQGPDNASEINANEKEIQEAPSEEKAVEQKYDITVFEGDLVDLKPAVVDPDGDEVTVGFTAPFNEVGEWQTTEGDEGQYSIIVTATDNKNSFVTKQIKVLVVSRNRPPAIDIPDTLEFNEGDLISLEPKIDDEDSSKVFVTYTGWMTTKNYQTTYEEAGNYNVTIMADDGKNKVFKNVAIVVKDINRPPTLNLLTPEIIVTEGSIVEVKAEATDPDGLPVEITFSEPLGKSGKWQTEKGQKGTYSATVSATDGVNEVTKNVEITIEKKNTPPVIESLSIAPELVILKQPGDKMTLKVDVKAFDPDGDNITIKYEGFMDSPEKTIEYGEKGGIKKVSVTVSDGEEFVTKAVTFDINNWPCFDCMQ